MQFDFRGYPGVGGDWQQNLCSQMTAVSDVFDALRTKRPYRGAMEMGKIAGIISDGAGSQLNPVLARIFLRLLDRLNAPGGSAASG
jgi:HD-GYP domain-containing protein (c-di-GMP phosphodiesterase class II)